MLVVFRSQVKIPGVPRVALGVKASVDVLKLNDVAGTASPVERQSVSRAAPEWQVARVLPLMVVLSDVRTRLNGFDISL